MGVVPEVGTSTALAVLTQRETVHEMSNFEDPGEEGTEVAHARLLLEKHLGGICGWQHIYINYSY